MSHTDQFLDLFHPVLGRDQIRKRTVAIACQGGGSHAAYTAGVLSRLLNELPSQYRLVGLSGASGGAVSATAAWYGLAADEHTPADILNGVWCDIAASNGWELWINELTLLKAQVSESLSLSGSPYSNPGSEWGRQRLETVLHEHIDFSAFGTLMADSSTPALYVSTVDVLTGDPVLFRDSRVTAEAVVASAAVPTLFEAVNISGAYYWDGFLSQNPPVVEFLTDKSLPSIDELWVIRLTPKSMSSLPTSEDEISNRKRQILENLSLTHELRFVELMNDWLASGKLSDSSFTETTIRIIELGPDQSDRSRLNRRSSFLSELYTEGETDAQEFLNKIVDIPDSD